MAEAMTTRLKDFPREPTPEECSNHAVIDDNGRALWFPQMGGYIGKAVAVQDSGGCINVFVWHNGEFPFTGTDTSRECWCWCEECPCCKDRTSEHPRTPMEIHLCMPSQFITFANQLEEFFS